MAELKNREERLTNKKIKNKTKSNQIKHESRNNNNYIISKTCNIMFDNKNSIGQNRFF